MRYIVLIAAVCMQMCLGATYSWSVYVQPIRELTGLQQGPVQIPFTVFYFIFPLAMLVAGNMLPRIGTRRSGMVGGFLFGGGWLLAGLGAEHFLYTVLGIGVIAGIGAGMAYIVPIAVCIRWFPRHKGLVTGIAVAGFGGGAALVSQVGSWSMQHLYYTPFTTFSLFGALFLVIVVSAGSAMRLPEGEQVAKRKAALPLQRFLTTPTFFLLYMAMFCGLAAGFAINANLKEMYTGSGDLVAVGVLGVSLFALANAAGRVIWGSLFDRLSSRIAIQANLFCQAMVLFSAPFMLDSAMGFYLVAFLAGFNYGGVLVVYVSSASRIWKSENVGQVYGWLFSSNIPASLAPLFAGVVYDHFHSFDLVFHVLATILVVGGVVVGWRRETITRQQVTASAA